MAVKHEMRVTLKAKKVSISVFLAVLVFVSACAQSTATSGKGEKKDESSISSQVASVKYKVTFVELGSVRCIPCQQMQPVMKSIEAKYGKEVKVDFHDVWTDAGKPYGVKYGIEAIPTQVFLDETGKEYYRHVGFFPEEELEKILQQKGVKLK